jgi:hypothetical protein
MITKERPVNWSMENISEIAKKIRRIKFYIMIKGSEK